MKKNKDLKIAYVTQNDPNDKTSWSGLHYYISKSLEKHCGKVYYIGPLKTRIRFFLEKFNLFTRLFGKNYAFDHNIILSKIFAKKISNKLKEKNFDLIFASAASTEIANLETDIPIIYYSDITMSLFFSYFKNYYFNLFDKSKKEANNIEKNAIRKAKLILYPSKWAACSAVKDYNADKSKIFIVPFGANIDKIPDNDIILQKKKSNKCRLLFIGVDWERKGGHIAFETLLELEKLGINAQLTVCGCIPPKEFKHDNMKVIPFLDKNDEYQYMKLEKLYLESDFFIFPTRREALGVVLCEASAFGLPIITTNTGGVPGVVTNGKNGFMLPLEAKGVDYAKLVKKIYENDEIYYNLVKSSRETFEYELNWDQWGKTVSKLMRDLL